MAEAAVAKPVVKEPPKRREISAESKAKLSQKAKEQARDPVTKKFIKVAKEGIADPDKARDSLQTVVQETIPPNSEASNEPGVKPADNPSAENQTPDSQVADQSNTEEDVKGVKDKSALKSILSVLAEEQTQQVIEERMKRVKDSYDSGVLGRGEAQSKLDDNKERSDVLNKKVAEAKQKSHELKDDLNPERRALGYDLDIHTLKENQLQINETIQEVEKTRDLPNQSKETKEKAIKDMEKLTLEKQKNEELLRKLQEQRKEIKENDQEISDQMVAFAQDIAENNLTADQKDRPLNFINNILSKAAHDETNRKALIERLTKKGLISKTDAKDLDDLLLMEKKTGPLTKKKVVLLGSGFVVLMAWLASKMGIDQGGG